MLRTSARLALLLLLAGLSAGLQSPTGAAGSRNAAPPSQATSFRFPQGIAEEPTVPPKEGPPLDLTASDGTGLTLVAFEANGVLELPLAFTELHLTFENPRDTVLEGRFRIALPPGAALSRFALKIGSSWQEGEVVERQRARQAYEDFLHRRQDPALLEQEAGNEFSARVFPIPARGRKELIVSYSHTLDRADASYFLPLRGLSQVGSLDVRVLLGARKVAVVTGVGKDPEPTNLGGEVSERKVVELHKRDWTPDRDFEISPSRIGGALAERSVLRQGNLVLMRVAAPAGRAESDREEIRGLYVLVDSSASRALGYAAQVRRLGELIAGLRQGAGAATPLAVAAFDQEVVPLFEGRVGDFGARDLEALAKRRPLGASDLEGALSWLGGKLARRGSPYPRVLLLTDGVATAGRTDTRDLKAAVRELREHGVERLDVLAVGGLRDDAVLRELAIGNLQRDGQRIDGSAPLAEIARRLTLACRSGIRVEVDGAEWVWPETLDSVQPGDEALIYADLPPNRLLRLSLDGRPVTLDEPAATERPLLERAWAQARIERLTHLRAGALGKDEDLRKALEHQIIEVSVKHRVLSPLTALLVLETENDYARFGLDRKGLADILTVGPGGLEVAARSTPVQASAPPPPPVARKAAVPAEPLTAARALERDDSPLRMGGDADAVAPVEVPEAVGTAPVPAGVQGGVAGGVAGGVVGGVPSPTRERMARPSTQPQPAEPGQPSGGNEDVITVTAESPLLDERRVSTGARAGEAERQVEEKVKAKSPYSGRYAEVMESLAAGRVDAARQRAEGWNTESPGDVLALLALGEAWEAGGDLKGAARAYGSLIDLFPSRADLRRLAGERLERLGAAGLGLAVDTYRQAVEQRPDHPSSHRLLAWALLRSGKTEEAFAALEAGIEQKYPGGRFAGVDRVLREDLGLLGAAWLREEPGRRSEIQERLRSHGSHLEDQPSLRFVLSWETDANDVDLHVYDRKGGHAYYEHKELPSGGELFADVTTGYGPECFAIPRSEKLAAAPYRLAVHYYSRGPMGYGMGTVQVVTHDGSGRLQIEPRPFVVIVDQAMVSLGTVGEGEKAGKRK